MKADAVAPYPPPTAELSMESRSTNKHPYSHYLAAAFAFLFDSRGRLLLLRENRGSAKYSYDLPGGTMTDEERPVSGLQREIFEETGLRIRLLSPLCWLKWDTHDTGDPILVAFYLAEVTDGDVSLSEEHESHRWIPVDELRRERPAVSAEWEIVAAMLRYYEELKSG